jgi:magnesium transporter
MLRLFKKSSHKAGLPPGTLVHIGERKTDRVTIDIFDYDGTHFEEKKDVRIEDCTEYKETSTVTWFNVVGIHDVDRIENLGRLFQIHPLTLEDIVHTGQRPKLDELEDYLFLTLKMIDYDEAKHEMAVEQVSIILGPKFVISFQEAEGDVFNPVRDRIRRGRGRIRNMGSDYLAYALIDAVVDNYFAVLENIGEQIEALQEEVLSDPTPQTLETIQETKRKMIFLRKSLWPLREVISALHRGESPLIHDSIRIYLRDVYDHTIQVIDSVETFRDMTGGTLDVYLSSLSNKMNQVMKVLTIIATIFIPLTFLAGVYGMNFRYMPELEWRWAYPLIWSVMVGLGVVMFIGFKRKKWL